MARRIPGWVKRIGLVLVGVAAAGAIAARTVDIKKWMLSQLADPHGATGWLVALTMPVFHSAIYGPAADLLQIRSDDELVEIACGSGAFLDKHARQAKRLAGLDLSEIQVRLARRRLADRITAGTAEVVQGDATVLPWRDARFTAAACMGSLEIFSDRAAALREMWRVLRPGGRLVVSYGLDAGAEELVREMEAFGIPNPTEEEARKMVEDAGFSLVSVTYATRDYPTRFLTGVKPQ